MGGRGSGKFGRYGIKGTVDTLKRLDIRYLKKQGMLNSGYYNISWTRNGTPSGNVNILVVAGESLTVKCNWRNGPQEEWRPMEVMVRLAHTDCAFGGSRQWFACPHCSRRMAVLIVDGPHVACRHCLNLTYASCNEDQIDRVWRKRDKYKAKMGGKDENLYLKPKGMHRRTWQRLRHQYYEAEIQGWKWASVKLPGLAEFF